MIHTLACTFFSTLNALEILRYFRSIYLHIYIFILNIRLLMFTTQVRVLKRDLGWSQGHTYLVWCSGTPLFRSYVQHLKRENGTKHPPELLFLLLLNTNKKETDGTAGRSHLVGRPEPLARKPWAPQALAPLIHAHN